MSKWLKTALFTALLIGASYWFGTICKQVGYAYELIPMPSGELLALLLWFLLVMGALVVSAGLVAALVRPVWVAVIAFALSSLAMLLGWQVTLATGVLVLVYLVASSLYAVNVARELDERIRFSVRSTNAGRGTLMMALVLVACGSLYLGYAAYIEREGFSLPEFYSELLLKQMEEQVEAQVPAEERQEAVAKLRGEFERIVDDFFERRVKPYERFIPLGVAAGVFMLLLTITGLLAWVPTAVLGFVFLLLTALRVTKVVSETREVQRLVID